MAEVRQSMAVRETYLNVLARDVIGPSQQSTVRVERDAF